MLSNGIKCLVCGSSSISVTNYTPDQREKSMCSQDSTFVSPSAVTPGHRNNNRMSDGRDRTQVQVLKSLIRQIKFVNFLVDSLENIEWADVAA